MLLPSSENSHMIEKSEEKLRAKKKMDYGTINLEQEELEIEQSLEKIRKLILEIQRTEYCNLTKLAKKCMRENLTTRPDKATLKDWLNNTKDVILFEMSKYKNFSYEISTDRIIYHRFMR
jgi:hypothetical protein